MYGSAVQAVELKPVVHPGQSGHHAVYGGVLGMGNGDAAPDAGGGA